MVKQRINNKVVNLILHETATGGIDSWGSNSVTKIALDLLDERQEVERLQKLCVDVTTEIIKLKRSQWSWKNKAKRHWSNWRKRGKIIESLQKSEYSVVCLPDKMTIDLLKVRDV